MLNTNPPTVMWPPNPQSGAEVPAKRSRRWLRWVIPIVAFIIGVGVGGAGNEPEATGSTSVLTLQGQLDSSQQQVDQLDGELDRARNEIRQATADGEAELQAQTERLQQRSAEVETRAKEVYAREKAVGVAERALTASQQAPSAVAVEPEPEVVTVPEAPTSVSYANCTAVRAAGAAPIHAGEAGYGRHLDRDGDGVGCE